MERNQRRVLTGVVFSNKMDKTVVVMVSRKKRHDKYEKLVEIRKKYYADTRGKDLKVGDSVDIMECRPISKTKKWRVI